MDQNTGDGDRALNQKQHLSYVGVCERELGMQRQRMTTKYTQPDDITELKGTK